MSLKKGNTKWVLFLSTSQINADDRHIFDLAFGVQCLESSGISPSNIHIYVDGQNRNQIDAIISVGTQNQYVIKNSTDFFADQKINTHDNLVMFVTGHGSMHGIDAAPSITPFKLLQALKTSPQLKHAIVYLGQCYAGVFNYVGAGRAKPANGAAVDPEVILIGAANLHVSLSTSTNEPAISGGALTWVANLFLLHVFKWMSSPVDIDGDARLTIMDSYKYAGVGANTLNKSIKIRSFATALELHPRWKAAYQLSQQNPADIQAKLSFDALDTQYDQILNVSQTQQDCWILNSIPAQLIDI